MFLMFIGALALAAVADAPPAQSNPSGASASEAPADGLKPGERRVKMVCKDHVRTGTRFAKKTCVELEAYRRQQEIDRQAFEEVQNRPMVEIRRGN